MSVILLLLLGVLLLGLRKLLDDCDRCAGREGFRDDDIRGESEFTVSGCGRMLVPVLVRVLVSAVSPSAVRE